MEKDLRRSHNPIDLGWSDGCAADPHCGISHPKANGEPLEEVGILLTYAITLLMYVIFLTYAIILLRHAILLMHAHTHTQAGRAVLECIYITLTSLPMLLCA